MQREGRVLGIDEIIESHPAYIEAMKDAEALSKQSDALYFFLEGLPVVLPQEEESVLVGSAVLGASASKDFSTIQDAMLSMCGEGTVTEPSKSEAEYEKYKLCS
uniref:FGGY carbohydrate kinase domain-containing protein n=1 Tax=Magallana gigas TaxID=29159 RepID=K1Q3X8_MAGGI